MSDMSIWDIHRSQYPWLLLYDTAIGRDVLRSLLTMADQGTNDLPRWFRFFFFFFFLKFFFLKKIKSHGAPKQLTPRSKPASGDW